MTTAPPTPRPTRDRSLSGPAPLRRPLALLAVVAGLLASVGPLVVCAAVGVIGWFLSDSGVHGTPTDGMGTGAVVWLAAHGSTVTVHDTVLTALPLGLTLVCVWTVWRISLRLGRSLAGHGPDSDRIADGERDWTVPAAGFFFGASYLIVAILVSSLPAAAVAPSTMRLVLGVLLLTVLIAVPAIAVGSGRAGVLASRWPLSVTVTLATARRVLLWILAVSTATLVLSLALHAGEVANTFSTMHSSAGEATLLVGLSALLVPNAIGFTSAWLLGPGFAVGTGTLVAPGVVVLGALPVFPLLAALPSSGSSTWGSWIPLLPALVAALAVARTQWVYPTTRWDIGVLRGGAGGLLAGLALALLTRLTTGSVGPGRMQHLGPDVGEVLVHALVAFGGAGLLAGAAMTAWQRRTLLEPDPASGPVAD